MTDTMRDTAQPSFGVREFFEGWRVQRSVWGALIMRELHTRYGRKGLGYAWLILEPMLLAFLVLILKMLHDKHAGPGMDIAPFIILGYVNFMMFRAIFNRGEAALESNKTLLHHRMVTIFDILMSRALLEAAGTFATLTIMLGFLVMVGMGHLPARPFELILGVLLMFWFAFGTSMLTCSLTYENSTAQKFVHPISYILLPLSGAFTMVQWLPFRIQQYAVWWPMSNIFELIRYGYFESATDRFAVVGYTVGCCLVLTIVGIISLISVRRKLTV